MLLVHFLTSFSVVDFIFFNPFFLIFTFGILTNLCNGNKKLQNSFYLFLIILIFPNLYFLFFRTLYFARLFFHNFLITFFFFLQLILVTRIKSKKVKDFFSIFVKIYMIGIFLLHLDIVCSLGFISHTLYYFILFPLYFLQKVLQLKKQ